MPRKPSISDLTVGRGAVSDPDLPQVGRMLDAGAMEEVLARSLGVDATLERCRIRYLRYKRATRLLVRYAVEVDGALHDASVFVDRGADLEAAAAAPEHAALAAKAADRAPTGTPLFFDAELEALVQWLPLDVTMPSLAERAEDLRRLLRDAGVGIEPHGEEPRLLAYKARRRAVLGLDGHVVKIYAGDPEFAGAVAGLEASSRLTGVRVPAREAVLADRKLTCQSLLSGAPPAGGERTQTAGTVLARLHRASPDGLPRFTPRDQLAAAAASARGVAAVAPWLEPRVRQLMRGLEDALPEVPGLLSAHGDFHANQLLALDDGLALIDFDEMCAAPGALDFGSYAAHLVTGDPSGLALAGEALDGLAEGYGGRPPALGWYVATSIVRRAPFPFRFMEKDWPDRVEQMVSDAEEAMAL